MKSEEHGSTLSNTKSYDLKDILGDPIFPYWMGICMKIDTEYMNLKMGKRYVKK